MRCNTSRSSLNTHEALALKQLYLIRFHASYSLTSLWDNCIGGGVADLYRIDGIHYIRIMADLDGMGCIHYIRIMNDLGWDGWYSLYSYESSLPHI